MKKVFLKTRPVCKVTFRLAAEAAGGAGAVALVGDFNDWSPDATFLKRRRDGSFEVTLALPTKRSYEFRYLIDSVRWENDWAADRYVPSAHSGAENSVVET